MKNRVFLLSVIALLLVTAGLFPNFHSNASPVIHQHEAYPAEPEGQCGFDDQGNLTSHLPLIVLRTQGMEIPGADRSDRRELTCDYSVYHRTDGTNSSAHVPTQTGRVMLSIRGNTSRELPKKQYSLKLIDAQGNPQNVALLGMPAESNWVLNGSYIDPSQIRNYMMNNLAGEIMDYACKSRLCEVLLTDSDGKLVYQGLYTLMEKPKVSKNRLALPEYSPNQTETSILLQMNTYLREKIHPEDIVRHLIPDDVQANNLAIEYPDPDLITPEPRNYIQQQLLQLDHAVYNYVHIHDWSMVERCIAPLSFADYYIINEFVQNYDAGNISTYFYQPMGGKIHIGPVWDFDGALQNFKVEVELNELRMRDSYYYHYLTQSPEFVDLCVDRYKQLRGSYLSDEYLLAYIDGAAQYLGSAAQRNSELWYEDGMDEFTEDVEDMKTYITERGAWLDEHFERLMKVAQ